MSFKNKFLSTIKSKAFWGEKEWRFGSINVLLCDLSLSINFTRERTIAEMHDYVLGNDALMAPNNRIDTYGITVEPFMVSLMGSNGDICWTSPGWNLMDWLSLATREAKTEAKANSDGKPACEWYWHSGPADSDGFMPGCPGCEWIREHRKNLCSGCVEGCNDYPLCKMGR